MIVDLEVELKEEKARLRALNAQQNKVQQDKDDVLLRLRRMESVSCVLDDASV